MNTVNQNEQQEQKLQSFLQQAQQTTQALSNIPLTSFINSSNETIRLNNIDLPLNNRLGTSLIQRLSYGIMQPKNGYLPLSAFASNTISDLTTTADTFPNQAKQPIYQANLLIREITDLYINCYINAVILRDPLDSTNSYFSDVYENFKNWLNTPYVQLNQNQKEVLSNEFIKVLREVTQNPTINNNLITYLNRIITFYNLKNIPWQSINFNDANDVNFKRISNIRYRINPKDPNQAFIYDKALPADFLALCSGILMRTRNFIDNLLAKNTLLASNTTFDFTNNRINPFSLVNNLNIFALTNNEVIDLVMSKNQPNNNHTLNLLAKYVFLNELNKNSTDYKPFGQLNKITLVNPLTNTIWTMDTQRIPQEIYDLVKYEVLGYGLNSLSLIRFDNLAELLKTNNTWNTLPYDLVRNYRGVVKLHERLNFMTNNVYGITNAMFNSGFYVGSKYVNDNNLNNGIDNYYTDIPTPPSRSEFYDSIEGAVDLSAEDEDDFFKSVPSGSGMKM